MRIFDTTKTQELNELSFDFERGCLKPDKLVITHHEAVTAVTVAEQVAELKAQGVELKTISGKIYRVIQSYDNGGKDVEEVTDIPAIEAYDDYEDIQVYVPYTETELKERADSKRHTELKAELAKVKEDLEQEQYGIIRNDYEQKKARAAEIINELRVLEGKESRQIIKVL